MLAAPVGSRGASRSAAPGIRARLGAGLLWLDEKPLLVVLGAGGATVAATIVLGSYAGWPPVLHVVFHAHAWAWLVVCLLGEAVAYGGYALTVRDIARVDEGADMDLGLSAKAVVGGFGVFAATRGSGGFAVDYWAFRRAGGTRRIAVGRILGLGVLEYTMLSLAALAASLLLFFDVDGHAGLGTTLPSLVIVPVGAAALWATSPARVARLTRTDVGWLRRKLAYALIGAQYVRRLLLSPREHGVALLGSALYWTGDIACLWAALQIADARVSVAVLVLAYSGGYVLTRRALPAGGAWLVAVALTVALTGMGVPVVPALVGVVIYRLFNFWLANFVDVALDGASEEPVACGSYASPRMGGLRARPFFTSRAWIHGPSTGGLKAAPHPL